MGTQTNHSNAQSVVPVLHEDQIQEQTVVPTVKTGPLVKVGCAWCSPSDNGTDGICDDCIKTWFQIEPALIHASINQSNGGSNPSVR